MITIQSNRLNSYLIFLWVIATVTLLLLPVIGFAQDSDKTQTTKVGFVNIPKIIKEAQQAKEARGRVRDEISGEKERLDACAEGFQKLEKKLRREGEDMPEARRKRMIDTLVQKRRECEEIKEDLNEDLNKERNKQFGKLQKLIYEVVETIAEKKNIDLVVGPPVVYYNDTVNLTDEVLAELSRRK